MATISGYKNSFNNLLYKTQRNVEMEKQVNTAARVSMNLRYKGENPIIKILNCNAAQLNGKHGDIIYKPDCEKHSRPYYGYDARIDTTLLDSVRNRLVDVSGVLIPNRQLGNANLPMNQTQKPLTPIGICV